MNVRTQPEARGFVWLTARLYRFRSDASEAGD